MRFTAMILLAGLAAGTAANAGTFDTSPHNWKNAPGNWENSPANWRNSPANWDNSPANNNAGNGIYDERGKRAGYAVRNKDGTVNLFDNEGNRTGYVPDDD